MIPPEKPLPPASPKASLDDRTTGLPGFRTWRGVYIFVFGSFVVYVALLAAFTRFYSR